MAKYQANPVIVDAFQITGIEVQSFENKLQITTEDGNIHIADRAMTGQYTPKKGDYWVHLDGYETIIPRDVFQRKYSLLAGSSGQGQDMKDGTPVGKAKS